MTGTFILLKKLIDKFTAIQVKLQQTGEDHQAQIFAFRMHTRIGNPSTASLWRLRLTIGAVGILCCCYHITEDISKHNSTWFTGHSCRVTVILRTLSADVLIGLGGYLVTEKRIAGYITATDRKPPIGRAN